MALVFVQLHSRRSAAGTLLTSECGRQEPLIYSAGVVNGAFTLRLLLQHVLQFGSMTKMLRTPAKFLPSD